MAAKENQKLGKKNCTKNMIDNCNTNHQNDPEPSPQREDLNTMVHQALWFCDDFFFTYIYIKHKIASDERFLKRVI